MIYYSIPECISTCRVLHAYATQVFSVVTFSREVLKTSLVGSHALFYFLVLNFVADYISYMYLIARL